MFDPLRFLTFSKHVVGLTPPVDEAFYRSGVSRAYYAALLVAREEARGRLGLGLPAGGKLHHKDIIEKYLKSRSSAKLRNIGQKLQSLKSDRENADYELGITVSQGDAQGAVLVAEDILQLISSAP